jgi:ABC-type transporter Mla subunit MlaD
MKILRFNESFGELAIEKTTDIISGLNQTSDAINDKLQLLDSISNDLKNYKSDSDKPNDQIDDSISNIQVVRKNLEESIEKIKDTIIVLNDYTDDGRKDTLGDD